MKTLMEKLQDVVSANADIQEAHELVKNGTIVHRIVWRKLYAEREKADRELWGTHADTRAETAKAILDFVNAERDDKKVVLGPYPEED